MNPAILTRFKKRGIKYVRIKPIAIWRHSSK